MATLLQDLRYGLRMLARSPGFTAVAVLTLALGIGANTAIFSVVKSVVLNALPFAHPERLVSLAAGNDFANSVTVSFGEIEDWKERSHSFASIATYRGWAPVLTGQGKPEVLRGARASHTFFPTLGVRPARGRAFLSEEDRPDRWHVVLLSHAFWLQRFGGDVRAIGQTLTLDHAPFEILGVLPADYQPLLFSSSSQPPDVWAPLGYDRSQPDACRTCQHLRAVARLNDGVSLGQARSEMTTIARQLSKEYPNDYPPDAGVLVTPLRERLVGKVQRALWLLFGATGCVLLIACVNAANLLLARAADRRQELALRITLGASRRRIVGQLLTESTLLSVMGGGAGILVAVWGISLFARWGPADIPRLSEATLDTPVLLFSLALSVLTGVLMGALPALQTVRRDQRQALQEGGRGTVGTRRSQLRNFLVVSEVALAFALSVATGLLLKSLFRTLEVNPGFEPRNLSVVDFDVVGPQYKNDEDVVRFEREALDRIRGIPGVEAAGIVSTLPLGGGFDRRSFHIQDRPLASPTEAPFVDTYFVSPDYFRAMGIRLKVGRGIAESDASPSAVPVALISESTAREMWPHENPIGKRIQYGTRNEKKPWATVVGIVADVRQYALDSPATPQAYFLYTHEPSDFPTLVVRSSLERAALMRAIEEQIWKLDKQVPIVHPWGMQQLLSRSLTQRRFTMGVISVFAALAILLATLGIYSVMAYSVARRTNEIGVRMALGAEPGNIQRLFGGEGLRLAAIGITAGWGIALLSTRFLRALLFGVGTADPLTYGVVTGTVLAMAILACVVPARRATKVDPMVALRYE